MYKLSLHNELRWCNLIDMLIRRDYVELWKIIYQFLVLVQILNHKMLYYMLYWLPNIFIFCHFPINFNAPVLLFSLNRYWCMYLYYYIYTCANTSSVFCFSLADLINIQSFVMNKMSEMGFCSWFITVMNK